VYLGVVTSRVHVRGMVRRLSFAAVLAVVAATSGVVAGPVAADDRLPDMTPRRPVELHVVTTHGRRLLKFTAEMVNVGDGAMEVLGRRTSSIDPWTVTQVIYDDAGGSRRVVTGAYLVYAGDGHDHWHVRKMMAYHLFSTANTRGDSKVGFCFFDTTLRYPSLPRSPSSRHYQEPWCGTRTATTSRTGISVGWGDRYSWKIAFQWIDITGLPSGDYVLRAIVDPYDWFLETNETNNCTYRRIHISGSHVTLRGAGERCITDWQDHPLATSIDWVFQQGITGGCDVLAFCPGAAVSRAQMAMFLDRAMHLDPTDQDFFTDDEGVTGEASINRLAAAGITGGCTADHFCPKAPVTRAQMASFFARALALPPATEPNHFDDDDGSTHEAAIDSLAEAGITGGCATRRFCPETSVTRAQMAAFLFRAFGSTQPPEGS
jgi:hypothetical protein